MKRPRKRLTSLTVTPLEPRLLLSGGGPTGTWIGQDGHDLAGLSRVLGGDDVQDIHIAIAGLPADRTIALADVQGLGGGRWESTGVNGWMAALVRAPGSSTADLYIDPYQVETGRPFDIHLTYDDGTTDELWVTGGAADPNLRMPTAALGVRWVGQDGQDHVGPGPSVGPDGIRDAHLVLSQLSANVAVASATIVGTTGDNWQFGLNHRGDANAELIRTPNDPTQADLFINPGHDLTGETLKVNIVYADGKTDSATVTAGHTDPALKVAPPAPVNLSWNRSSARWVGQDGENLSGPGAVHVALDGIPAGRAVVAATLTDGVAGTWVYRGPGQASYYADPYAGPLAFRPSSGQPSKADIDFPPIRDESDATMTLRLLLDDGTTTVTSFPGGFCDPGLRAPGIAPGAVVAHPGDNLNDLANRFGSVHLAAGTYALSQPLVLNNPVAITADPGVTLVFSQGPSDPPWTAAIKIHASHTTLDGFAVRFAGPIRWNLGVSYGPAVIGTTDNLDQGHNDPKFDIVITHLDLLSPPPSTSNLEQAPSLMRLVSAASGRVAANVLKGGTTEVFGGPWQIIDNDYRGTVPGTFAYDAFAGHHTHDLVIDGNQVHPVGASGKTWRFLVLNQGGAHDLVQDNVVTGIGPRDDDTIPSMNAAEIVLTEAYRLHFEGAPSAISADGRVLQIPQPQGGPAQAGDVVAILAGPDAGQWRLITQAISPTAYLLDRPLSAGDKAVSIVTGFVGVTFQGNAIDARGSSVAADLDLEGGHFGTRIVGNHLLGGGEALRITAPPTEFPNNWGWSHVPFLGAVISGNTLQDSLKGGTLDVVHGPAIKSNKGRVYMDVTLNDNTILWTDGFLSQYASKNAPASPPAMTIGDASSIDPGELVVHEQGNKLRVPAGYQPGATERINSATLNGQQLVNQSRILPTARPPAPAHLRQANLFATRATDGAATDGSLQFDPVLGAAGYEYRLGSWTTYRPIGARTTFTPAGLVRGTNTVFVRAVDANGQRGSDGVLLLVYIPDAMPKATWIGQDGHDLVNRSHVLGGDGYQDVHIQVTGLPANRNVILADLEGLGGGRWQSTGLNGWVVAFVWSPGSTTADLYFQPSQVENGRPFNIKLTYNDGTTDNFWVAGSQAEPSLRISPAPPSGQTAGASHEVTPAAPAPSSVDASQAGARPSIVAPGPATVSPPATIPTVVTPRWKRPFAVWMAQYRRSSAAQVAAQHVRQRQAQVLHARARNVEGRTQVASQVPRVAGPGPQARAERSSIRFGRTTRAHGG